MIVLGIESSCDDSAAAILRDGALVASVVSSQDAVHGPYGGVVPELASRHHVRNVLPVIDAALARAAGDYACLGRTRDDAVGEAFDKAATMLGLGYPGGPVIDRLARDGDPTAIRFPRATLKRGRFDFSFSGFKTALRQHVEAHPPDRDALPDVAASLQEALVDMLVDTTVDALGVTGVERLVVSGGVAANRRLRTRMAEAAGALGVEVLFPRTMLCTDNAAMIALAGAPRLAAGEDDGLGVNADADLPFGTRWSG